MAAIFQMPPRKMSSNSLSRGGKLLRLVCQPNEGAQSAHRKSALEGRPMELVGRVPNIFRSVQIHSSVGFTAGYWPNVDDDVEEYVRQCRSCAEAAKPTLESWTILTSPGTEFTLIMQDCSTDSTTWSSWTPIRSGQKPSGHASYPFLQQSNCYERAVQ